MSSIPAPADVAATFCATLVDEWVRCGVRQVMIAPGSRSTPLALALAGRDELSINVFHDERAAGFAALGAGLSTGMPAIVLCSSGTAAAHLHAAVIEADQSRVPMIVCTADRPVELRDVGAPQTIDQTHLYGRSVRWFVEPGVADDSQRHTWRSLAARAVVDSTRPTPGPVHLNLAFREPLLGRPQALPPSRNGRWVDEAATTSVLSGRAALALSAEVASPRGIVVAGKGVDDPAAIHAFAAAAGWPVLADPRSGCRIPARTTVAAFDAILRQPEFASTYRPAVVVRIGEPPASKVLAQWIAASGARQIQIDPDSRWIDPDHLVARRVTGAPAALLAQLGHTVPIDPGWLAGWSAAESAAQAALSAALEPPGADRQGADRQGADRPAADSMNEPAVARALVSAMPDGASLVVSSSMPVRDVEWYGAPRNGLVVYSNRGANGIDGVVSTAIGVAIGSASKTVLLIGDVALLHDASALTALARRGLELTVVVIDNDGGGIFSFLPQGSAVPADRFEQIYGTPHGTDIVALARAHRLPAVYVDDAAALGAALRQPATSVVVVQTDRHANVAVHERVHAAVAAAVQAATRTGH
jgi:2-succinyl-5-enolpyruvyl-6-hydroxy-3-cyclohexene-1-carboxylate synthase